MKKLFLTQTKLPGLPAKHVVETFISDERPQATLCAAAYAIVVKNGSFLVTDINKNNDKDALLDIPGGDIPFGVRIEGSLIEHVLEQTGILVDAPTLVAYKETILNGSKPDGWLYPYPISYVLFYLCEYRGGEVTHGAHWVSQRGQNSGWYTNNKIFLQEILKHHKKSPIGGRIFDSIRARRRLGYIVGAIVFVGVIFGLYAYVTAQNEIPPTSYIGYL